MKPTWTEGVKGHRVQVGGGAGETSPIKPNSAAAWTRDSSSSRLQLWALIHRQPVSSDSRSSFTPLVSGLKIETNRGNRRPHWFTLQQQKKPEVIRLAAPSEQTSCRPLLTHLFQTGALIQHVCSDCWKNPVRICWLSIRNTNLSHLGLYDFISKIINVDFILEFCFILKHKISFIPVK